MPLSIFDLDNTLLNGDSDHAWGEFLASKGAVDGKIYQQANDSFYQQYQDGNLDIHQFLEFSLKPLAENSKEQLDIWHQEFMRDYIVPMLQQKAYKLLQTHREQGHFLLIITATNGFITEPIAELLGVDAILATNAEFKNGCYTGKVAGTPCFQHGKIIRLMQWLENKAYDLTGSYFYSDSHNDLPLLKIVENPIAVDADETLSNFAKQNQWPHISLREEVNSLRAYI